MYNFKLKLIHLCESAVFILEQCTQWVDKNRVSFLFADHFPCWFFSLVQNVAPIAKYTSKLKFKSVEYCFGEFYNLLMTVKEYNMM